MSDFEYVGKIRGMKTLKQMIEGREVIPALQLPKNKAATGTQEKAFEQAIRSEESHRTRSPQARWRGVSIGLESFLLEINSPHYYLRYV